MESLEMATKNQLIDVRNVYSLFIKNGTARLHVADIDLIPRVDAVEVVRCRECKHRYTMSSGMSFCSKNFLMDAKDDDYCSCGERRTDG